MAPVPVHASQEDKQFRYYIPGGASFHLEWSLPRAKVPPSVLGSIRLGGTLGDIALVAGQTSHPSEYIAVSINPYVGKAIAGLLLPFQMGLVGGSPSHMGPTQSCVCFSTVPWNPGSLLVLTHVIGAPIARQGE